MGVRAMLDRNEELQLTWPPAHLAISALRQALAALTPASWGHVPNRPIALSNIGGGPPWWIHHPHPAVTPGTLDGYICARELAVWGANPHRTVGILQMDERGCCQ